MYTISYPSGTLRLDDTIIAQVPGDPAYEVYVAWLSLGNGPTVLEDPPAPPATATAAQWADAMTALSMDTVTAGELTTVFDLAATL